MYLRANTPTVVAEVIDGEAVLINFETGSYFSLSGAGADAWVAVADGATIEEVVSYVEARYDSSNGSIATAITALLEDLQREGLVVEGEPGGNSAAGAPEAVAERRPFVAPKLDTFTDMQEMLLLDPIHDVEQAGWPYPDASQVKPDTAAAS